MELPILRQPELLPESQVRFPFPPFFRYPPMPSIFHLLLYLDLPHNPNRQPAVPISALIISGAISFALSTRVRGMCHFAFKFLTHPFVAADPADDPPATLAGGSPPLGGARQPQRQPRKRVWRSYRHARNRNEHGGLKENDFWLEHRDKLDVEYVIPVHNIWEDRDRGLGLTKGPAGRRRGVAA